MHRRMILALAVMFLGAGAFAANSTSGSTAGSQTQQTQGSNVQAPKGSGNSGSTMQSGQTTGAGAYNNNRYESTGSDAGTARYKGESGNPSGGAAGGYVAAGIGIAALIGLFASRRGRGDRDVGHRHYGDDDDINRPGGGTGPTTRM